MSRRRTAVAALERLQQRCAVECAWRFEEIILCHLSKFYTTFHMTFIYFYDEFCLHSDDFMTDEGAKTSPVNPQQVGVGRAAAIGH